MGLRSDVGKSVLKMVTMIDDPLLDSGCWITFGVTACVIMVGVEAARTPGSQGELQGVDRVELSGTVNGGFGSS